MAVYGATCRGSFPLGDGVLVLQQVAAKRGARPNKCLPGSRLPGKRAKKTQPTCVIIDTQSVKNAATATGSTVGFDAGKLVKGRKRLVLIDTLGNVLASWVVPAGESDAATAIACWDAVAAQLPLLGRVQVVMGDSSFAGLFADHLRQRYGLRFEKPAHIVLKKKNFCIHKKRWLVERTLAWLSANRRLSKEYDRLLTRANAWLTWANIRRILKFC